MCVLLGAGPSASRELAETVRGRARVLAINSSFRLAPWADALYACDCRWWDKNPEAVSFSGLKVTQEVAAVEKYGLNLVDLAPDDRNKPDDFIVDRPGVLARGGNGGYQAVNLLIQFGARRILCVLDYRGEHWHGPHPAGLANPLPTTLPQWAAKLDGQARRLRELGVELIDVTNDGALTAYPKMSAQAALQHWA